MGRCALYVFGLLVTIALLLVPAAPAAVYWDEPGTLGAANRRRQQPELEIPPVPAPERPDLRRRCDRLPPLLVPQWFGIWRVHLEGPATPTQIVSGLNSPGGIAVDGSHVYWVNRRSGSIGRAALDGSAREDSFISGLREPSEVAVDDRHLVLGHL